MGNRYPGGERGDGAEPMGEKDWHGLYLTEDEIVADMLSRIKADPVAVTHWLDPVSWRMPFGRNGEPLKDAPNHAGCLMFSGMSVRNYYGLWRVDCPITKSDGDDLEIVDGIITDARHPDNLSGRIIDRVRQSLQNEMQAA